MLQLFQPVSLSLLVTNGAIVAIASFLFAFPEYNASCALRQPIILTSITFMGNLLIARAWRIGCIISSTATFAACGDKVDAVGAARLKVMNFLTTLSQWGRYVGSCGRAKIGRRRRSTGIRRTITFVDSICVAMVLLVPQLVLQIVNLSVPSVRMESVEIIFEGEGCYTCESRAGPYFLIVGIVLAALPFGISLLVNVKSEGVPDNFRELDDILASIAASFWMLVTTLPTAGMIGQAQPNARAYLLAASALSLVLPLSYNLARARLQNVNMSPGLANSKERPSIRRGAQWTSTSSDASSSSGGRKVEDDLQILAAAVYSKWTKTSHGKQDLRCQRYILWARSR